jgi:putative membrane protein
MAKKETQNQNEKRILILCVDRDDDVEVKAGVKTPLLGRTANLDGAVALALKDPEEPDANAMFEAVRLYDRLQNEKQPEEIFEVATISGSDLGGVSADRKVVSELNNLLESFTANEVILVSDGYSDEAVLPLVESRVPVSSVRRIVIKHSESIEETAAVFTKYVKLLVDNPRYARVALGLPGLLVFIFGVLWAINNFVYPGAIDYYGIAIVIVLGGFLLIKGFGVDKSAKDAYNWIKDYSPPSLPMQISNYTVFAGILCVAVSVYLGVQNVNINAAPFPSTFAGWVDITPKIITFFIEGMEDLVVIGIIIVLFGRSVRLYFERDSRLLRNMGLIVTVAWFRWILDALANVIYNPHPSGEAITSLSNPIFSVFIYTIVVGILIGIASVLLIFIINRSTKDFFQKHDKDETTKGQILAKNSTVD